MNFTHQFNIMKNYAKLLTGLILIIFSSCVAKKNINSEYDVNVDFNSFKTYMFLPWNPKNSEYVNKTAQQKLYGMLEAELSKIGYEKVEHNADLVINLMVLLDEQRSAIAYTRYYNTGGYGYYSPFGFGYNSTTYYKKFDVLEGTIVVDVFDQKEKKLIWQGISIQEIVENDAQRERQVIYSIKKMFQGFPE